MYRQGSDEDEIAMHDFYTDYAAALATLDPGDENYDASNASEHDTGWENNEYDEN